MQPNTIPNIERYLAYCKTLKVSAKSDIYVAADIADSLFFIVEGTVAQMMEDSSGKEMIVGYLNPGSFFGELGIYDNAASCRGARAVARSDCELGEMRYERFLELTRIYPSLMRELDSQIISRLKHTTQKMLDMASLDAPGRIARCLCELCELPQAEQLDEGVKIKVSRQEISKIVGCTRESVGRIIQTMHDEGLLESKGMTMIVYDQIKQVEGATN